MQTKQNVLLAGVIAIIGVVSLVLANALVERNAVQNSLRLYADLITVIENDIQIAQLELDDGKLLGNIAGLAAVENQFKKNTQQKLIQAISNYHLRGYDSIFILDDLGQVVYHPKHPLGIQLELTPFTQMLELEKGQMKYEEEGETILAAYTYVHDWNWLIVLSAKKSDVLREDSSSLFYLLGATLFLYMAAYYMLWRNYRETQKRIRGTLEYLKKLDTNHYEDRLSIEFDDDIGELQQEINHVVEKVQLHTSELELNRKKLEDSNSELSEIARLDGLTGIPNRRDFDHLFDQEWSRCRRENKSLALMMIDVDFFKNYNDYYGHMEGDECLKKVALVISHPGILKRPGDVAARYGGEEFVVMLTNPTREYAAQAAESLRTKIMELGIPHAAYGVESGQCVTISIGVSFTDDLSMHSKEVMLERADRNLYRAKKSGRNTVVIDDPISDLVLSNRR